MICATSFFETLENFFAINFFKKVFSNVGSVKIVDIMFSISSSSNSILGKNNSLGFLKSKLV